MDYVLFGTTAILMTYTMQWKAPVQIATNKKKKKEEEDSIRSMDKMVIIINSTTSISTTTTLRDAHERVCTVSEDNIPTPKGHFRWEMRDQNLWHRATYCFIRHVVETRTSSSSFTKKRPDENCSVVLVQRRSLEKDYCPGKLDPTPGGVVGFDETTDENAQREMYEEMGIDVVASSSSSSGHTMEYLFTFPYQDDRVKVWGSFYQIDYTGRLEDLKLQKEEVQEVIPMTLGELRARIELHPEDFMPDSCHAMKLYFQRTVDMKVKRRLLKGYSSGDLDRYRLRPKPKVVFFDCDDTLYFDGWKTANQLTAKIEDWCVNKVGLPPGKAYELYKQYGTCLRGLLAEGILEDSQEAIDKFLEEVHDLPIHELLKPDPKLREILLQMDPSVPKYIFTASVSHHAERCLKALGIDDLFEDVIIDVKRCKLETKYSRNSFDETMKIAGVDDPEACVFFDDSVKNIEAAREIGWRSILVGRTDRDCGTPVSSDDAEVEIDHIHQITNALPELFDERNLL